MTRTHTLSHALSSGSPAELSSLSSPPHPQRSAGGAETTGEVAAGSCDMEVIEIGLLSEYICSSVQNMLALLTVSIDSF